MDPTLAIISAVSGIFSSVTGSIDKSNAYYTQRQSDRASSRTGTTLTRSLTIGLVAIAVIVLFISLSKK